MDKDKPFTKKQSRQSSPFAANPNKPKAEADLKQGIPVDAVSRKYNIPERTVWRYAQDLKSKGLIPTLDRTATTPGNTEKSEKADEPIFPAENDATDTENTDEKDDEMADNKEENKVPEGPGGGTPPPTPPATTAFLIFREGGIGTNIVIPPFVFTMFDLGKQYGVIQEDMDFDVWMVECVVKRFALDYKLQLGLSPIMEEDDDANAENGPS